MQTTNPPLTRRQRQVLEYIRSRRLPPTVREIAAAMCIKSPNGVLYHLNALEQKGYIARDRVTARGIRVLSEEQVFQLEDMCVSINAARNEVTVTLGPPSTWAEGGEKQVTFMPYGIITRERLDPDELEACW